MFRISSVHVSILRFVIPMAICLTALSYVHHVPKLYGGYHNNLRFIYTTTYFGCLLFATWMMLSPRSDVLHDLYDWHFQDCPPTIDRAWRRYLTALDRLTFWIAVPVMAWIGSTALFVLGLWNPRLHAFDWWASWTWWISVIIVVLIPFMHAGLIRDTLIRRHQVWEELSLTTWYSPRPWRLLLTPNCGETPKNTPAVAITGKEQFRAGGLDWNWDRMSTNAVIFGQTGSGKTICILNALLEGLVKSGSQNGADIGGLILDPKGDFREKIEVLCKQANRSADLVVLDAQDPARSIRWNPFDSDDDSYELAGQFAAVLESVGMKSGESSFWIDSARTFVAHAIDLLRLTNPGNQPPTFQQIASLASNLHAIADRTDVLDLHHPNSRRVLDYFANNWGPMASETRSGIQSHLVNMLQSFLIEPYLTLFGGKSGYRTDELVAGGKILYVNFPLAEKELMSRTICTFMKLAYYRSVLKAVNKPRRSFFLCDEFQRYLTSSQGKGDAEFFERSRQSRHVNLVATQNLSGMILSVARKEAIISLLGNCATKIFLRGTDRETNQFSSELFGQALTSLGSDGGSSGRDRWWVPAQTAGGGRDQFEAKVRPERFAELTIPCSAEKIDYCEAIVHDASAGRQDYSGRKTRWKVHPIRG